MPDKEKLIITEDLINYIKNKYIFDFDINVFEFIDKCNLNNEEIKTLNLIFGNTIYSYAVDADKDMNDIKDTAIEKIYNFIIKMEYSYEFLIKRVEELNDSIDEIHAEERILIEEIRKNSDKKIFAIQQEINKYIIKIVNISNGECEKSEQRKK